MAIYKYNAMYRKLSLKKGLACMLSVQAMQWIGPMQVWLYHGVDKKYFIRYIFCTL